MAAPFQDMSDSDEWSDAESDAAEGEQRECAATTGRREYFSRCAALEAVPCAMLVAKLRCEHINLRHAGMGVKGARALAAALAVNEHIRSLNLGDNAFGDEGCTAFVGLSNTTLTSLNLADNQIGFHGMRSLASALPGVPSLRELVLKGNVLDDRAAVPLTDALSGPAAASLTRLDVSYNTLGEASGLALGEMIASNAHLLDLDLGWNSLRGAGGSSVAQALPRSALRRINLSWNSIGDQGAVALGEAIPGIAALTHLDISHNRIGRLGATALADGLRRSSTLTSCELSHNPMGLDGTKFNLEGVSAIVDALRSNRRIESAGLTDVHEGASYKRGAACRFSPTDPDGSYKLDCADPWDAFLLETLHAMSNEPGETWMHVRHNGAPLVVPDSGESSGELPKSGLVEFEYVSWRRGLEAALDLDLSNAGDRLLAELAEQRVIAGDVCCHWSKLDGTPFALGVASLPAAGSLRAACSSTTPQDELTFEAALDLSSPAGRATALRLWERQLTSPLESWRSASLDDARADPAEWQYPHLPEQGTLKLEHTVELRSKPLDRGRHLSPPMAEARFDDLMRALSAEQQLSLEGPAREGPGLLSQAAGRAYFTAEQAAAVLRVVRKRKGRARAMSALPPRVIDPQNLSAAVQRAFASEAERQEVMGVLEAALSERRRGFAVRSP